MDLTAFKEQLDELEERYQEWVEPINHVIQECSYRVNRDGYTPADFERDVRRTREKQLAKYNPYEEMNEFLDRLCPAYLSTTAQQRAEIRAAVSERRPAECPARLRVQVGQSDSILRRRGMASPGTGGSLY